MCRPPGETLLPAMLRVGLSDDGGAAINAQSFRGRTADHLSTVLSPPLIQAAISSVLITLLLCQALPAQSVSVTEYPIPTTSGASFGGAPYGITPGPDGALWFTLYFAGQIGRITTTGSVTLYPVPWTHPGWLSGITTGSDGALWFTQWTDAGIIGRITTSGVITQFPLPQGFVNPISITSGPDGALWFGSYTSPTLARMTTAGTVTVFPLPAPDSGGIQSITTGPDGALWFTEIQFSDSAASTETGVYKIGRATTSGVITEFRLPSACCPPQGIVAGPDGALWFTELSFTRPSLNVLQYAPASQIGRMTTTGVLTEFPVSTAVNPDFITVGPDGALWFTDQNSTSLRRITTAGAITEFPVPGSYLPHGIATGPDGALWFADFGNNKIGRVVLTATANPVITGLSPSSATAGGPSFTLTVNGSGFLNTSTVQWNGSSLTTTYISGTQLSAVVPSAQIATPGLANVSVLNPGGVTSNAVTFTITAPTPLISSISPSSATAGVPALTLTVNGTGFLAGSAVQWNGSSLSTTYMSGNQLTASVAASQIASQGTANVTVVNPGGATSNAVTFTINAPTPSISSLSPNSATAGAPAFTLTVSGSGFLVGSTVRWNGSALSTNYVSGTQLNASVPASLIASQGTASVTVANPGGATSPAVTFTINPPTVGPISIITSSPLPTGAVGVPYSQALAATGGVTPYKGWAVSAGNLPPGISLSNIGSFLTGLLNGVPTTPGTFSFTVQVTDGANTVATKQFSLTITGGSVSISANGVVNAASYAGGSVSPGEIITIFGSGLGPSTLVGLQLDSRGYVSTSLAGTQVLFDGVAAPLIYTLAGQVSAVVPYAVSGKASTQLQVTYQGQNSNLVTIPVTSVVPGIFTIDASGKGPGAIVNQDGTVNSAVNPAAVGSYVFVYATGEGQTTPGGIDGKPGDAPAPTPVTQPVTATVGGVNAQVQYAGGVPGLVAGVLQVNVLVPQGVASGNSVPIVLNVGGQSTQTSVTLSIR